MRSLEYTRITSDYFVVSINVSSEVDVRYHIFDISCSNVIEDIRWDSRVQVQFHCSEFTFP
jgi:hypothetical protein